MTKRFLLFFAANETRYKGAETFIESFDSLLDAADYAKKKIHEFMVRRKTFDDNITDKAGVVQQFLDTEGWAHVLDLETKQIIEI